MVDMPRSDRLANLITVLRDGRLHRAQDLADRLGVSLRTIYRDMDRLIGAGLPVEGTRGLGYKTTAAVTLPVLNLSLAELEALQLGLAIVGERQDAELARAARAVLAYIDAGLPADRGNTAAMPGPIPYPLSDAARGFAHMPALRAALKVRQKLRIASRDPAGTLSERVVRPLQLEYWGRLWTLAAWCETRDGLVLLRVDHIETLQLLPQLFLDEPGKTLADYLATSAEPGGTGQT